MAPVKYELKQNYSHVSVALPGREGKVVDLSRGDSYSTSDEREQLLLDEHEALKRAETKGGND